MAFPLIDYRQTKFLTSAPNLRLLPEDQGVEIAFAGRSNAGKSSALNTICDRKNLAKTSRTPGRTRLINLFEVFPGFTLVDLPGYGYAKVSETMKRDWQRSMSEYLQNRNALRGLVVVMDIRHPLKDHDRLILDWSTAANLPTLLLLTKCDKIGTNKSKELAGELSAQLANSGGSFTVIAFSSLKKIGVDQTRDVLSSWYHLFSGTLSSTQEIS